MRRFLLTALFFLSATLASAQTGQKADVLYLSRIIDGDTVPMVIIRPVYVFSKPLSLKKFQKLINNLKIVYPIALRAQQMLDQAEKHLLTIDSRKEQRKYLKQMEDRLKSEYTPVLKKMTYSQGKLLIKLIDRQTDRTSYDIVKELRGGFTAFFWQGVARIFGANLKDTYDKSGEDQVIEYLITLYEAGVL